MLHKYNKNDETDEYMLFSEPTAWWKNIKMGQGKTDEMKLCN